MNSRFVDTNIFLRYLINDNPAIFQKCKELFKNAFDGKLVLATSAMVIAELVWTLLSYYRVPKSEIIEKIAIIVGTENIIIPDKDIIADALALYSRKNIDYIDAYNAVFMKYYGIDEIYSYDADYDSIEDVIRMQP